MPRYVSTPAVGITNTDAEEFWTIAVDGTTTHRLGIYELLVGSDASADNACNYEIARATENATPNGTAVTPVPLNLEDAVAQCDFITQPDAVSATTILMNLPVNQRATYRWVAAPGSELWASVTVNQGFVAISDLSTAETAFVTFWSVFHIE